MHTRIRLATAEDAPGLQAIYAPFCENTPVSFETIAPSVADMAARVQKITAQFPWLVCVRNEAVLGYAYACAHRERAAYRWAVDVAVYLGEGQRRQGLGRALYTTMFQLLVAQGYFKAYAGITLPNPASVGLHEAMGFQPVGIYRGVGCKFGAWHDVGWWQLNLQPEVAQPAEPISIATLADTSALPIVLDAGSQLLPARVGKSA